MDARAAESTGEANLTDFRGHTIRERRIAGETAGRHFRRALVGKGHGNVVLIVEAAASADDSIDFRVEGIG